MIPSYIERRLAQFVDRVSEMDRFCQMLDTREKPIMVVWGDAGLGKTSLFFRMIHECAVRKLRRAEVIWSDTRSHTYLDVMCKIRDDVGVDFFKGFTKLAESPQAAQFDVNLAVATTGEIVVGADMVVEHSRIENVAGVVIQKPTFVLPGIQMAERANLENSRMIRLHDRFIQDLAQAVSDEPLVVFFDGVEKMKDDCHKWVWGELLRAVVDGKLGKISFVLCGRKRPELEGDMELMVEEAELRPLGQKDIVEYLVKRANDENAPELVQDMGQVNFFATTLLKATQGQPLKIANAVDGALQERKKGSSSG